MRSEADSPAARSADAADSTESTRRQRFARIVGREVREHRTAYVVLVSLTFVGIALIPMIFPDATLGQRALGGLCLGSWAALSAVPGHFF